MLLLCVVNLLRVNVLQMKGKRPETCLMNSVTFVVVVQVKQTDIYRVKEHERVILEPTYSKIGRNFSKTAQSCLF